MLACGLMALPALAQETQPQSPQAQAAPSDPKAATHPAAPLVTYENGQLTVVAENATLSQVMSALHSVMGTQVEVPAGSADERVWAHLGPGSAHRVLMDLFANTDLDYVVQGSPTDPSGIRSVTLSVRGPDTGKSGPAGEESASGPRRPRFMNTPAPAPEPERVESEAAPPAPAAQEAAAAPATGQPAPAADSTPATSQPAATPEPSVAPATQANMSPTGTPNIFPESPQPSAGSFNPHPSPPPTMNTDQMVQQLTNMYQQRRQMQAAQTSSTPN